MSLWDENERAGVATSPPHTCTLHLNYKGVASPRTSKVRSEPGQYEVPPSIDDFRRLCRPHRPSRGEPGGAG